MIEIGGKMRPGSCEEATQIADEIDGAIEKARGAVYEAQRELLKVCVEKFPVGSYVSVHVAAGRSPTHEVVGVNEHGWLTLKNTRTGTTRGMMADSLYLRADRCWYEKIEKETKESK